MISFKEFLSSQAERLKVEQAAWDQAIEGWVASVVALIERIEAWIKESDPNGLVRIEHDFSKAPSLETRTYVDANLNLGLGDRETSIRPVAFGVLGPRWKPGEGKWSGRVDMTGDPHGYELFRFLHNDGRDEWFIRNTDNYEIKSLDRSSFDEAIIELLS